MARVMVRVRKRPGLMAFDQHALRYRGVMELAWAGCTDDEIASFSGHTSKAILSNMQAKRRKSCGRVRPQQSASDMRTEQAQNEKLIPEVIPHYSKIT